MAETTTPKTAPAPGALLGPDDPPVVSIVNPQGRAPILLVCDHASKTVPKSLGRLGLEEAEIDQHIGWDIGAAGVTLDLGRRLGAPSVHAGFSRLVFDCNRFPHDPSAVPAVSDGIAIPGNAALSAADRQARHDALFVPYHAAIEEVLAGFAARGVVPAFLAIHSMTPVMKGVARPWHFGVLWDKDPRIAQPLLANLGATDGVVVGDNEPYSAREPVGYTVATHAVPRGLPHVGIEIRQDLISTEAGVQRWAAILANALDPILARPDLYRAQVY